MNLCCLYYSSFLFTLSLLSFPFLPLSWSMWPVRGREWILQTNKTQTEATRKFRLYHQLLLLCVANVSASRPWFGFSLLLTRPLLFPLLSALSLSLLYSLLCASSDLQKQTATANEKKSLITNITTDRQRIPKLK